MKNYQISLIIAVFIISIFSITHTNAAERKSVDVSNIKAERQNVIPIAQMKKVLNKLEKAGATTITISEVEGGVFVDALFGKKGKKKKCKCPSCGQVSPGCGDCTRGGEYCGEFCCEVEESVVETLSP